METEGTDVGTNRVALDGSGVGATNRKSIEEPLPAVKQRTTKLKNQEFIRLHSFTDI